MYAHMHIHTYICMNFRVVVKLQSIKMVYDLSDMYICI